VIYSIIPEIEALERKLRYYSIMGIRDVRLSKESKSYIRDPLFNIRDLDELRQYIEGCRRCELHKGRKNIVIGEGSTNAQLVFVGEAPGREEDLEGRPFVGEAGRLLTKIIDAMSLKREDVYICNVIKCRPPRNRDPKRHEMERCIPYLEKQLEIIAPEVICTLGRIALIGLFRRDMKITEVRGKWLKWKDIPVMPTYHPAFLLRNPSSKREVWEDMKQIMRQLGLEGRN